MKIKGIIEKIEEGILTIELEDGKLIERKSSNISFKEGDIVTITNGILIVDREETLKRKKDIDDLFNELSK